MTATNIMQMADFLQLRSEEFELFLNPPTMTEKQMIETKLPKPRGASTADQCRAMGLAVGDTIIGMETYNGGWNEASLTVLWIGRKEVAFDEQTRSSLDQKWGAVEESCCWNLAYRDWRKISADSV